MWKHTGGVIKSSLSKQAPVKLTEKVRDLLWYLEYQRLALMQAADWTKHIFCAALNDWVEGRDRNTAKWQGNRRKWHARSDYSSLKKEQKLKKVK